MFADKIMRYLSQGQESKKIIEILLSLTKIKEPMQDAIVDHLVRGFSVSDAANLNDVRSNNLSVAIRDLNAVAAKVERINELKTYDKSHTNKG